MDFEVITNAEETYERAMSKPNIKSAELIVAITGIVAGLFAVLLTGNFIGIIAGIVINFVQWIVLSATLWILYVMFKKKKTGDISFEKIGSATGKLWTIMLAINVLILIGVLLLTNGMLEGLVGLFMAIILVILGISLLYSHYKLVKAMFSANTGRHIIVWFSSILVSSVVSGAIISLINLVL